MSYNKPLVLMPNATDNLTLSRHCLMNADMVDLHASIHSTVILVNVFCYTGIGLILPTIIIFILSLLLFRKGAQIWHELHSHHSDADDIALRCSSPIVDYLRTYNAAFSLAIVFVFLSLPCKLLRLLVVFASNNILLHAHEQMQTIGLAFELSLHSYKCLVFICTNYRFRCALKCLLRYHRANVVFDRHRLTIASLSAHKRSFEQSCER